MPEPMKITQRDEKVPNTKRSLESLEPGTIFEYDDTVWLLCKEKTTIALNISEDSLPVISLIERGSGLPFEPNGLDMGIEPTKIFDAELVLREL